MNETTRKPLALQKRLVTEGLDPDYAELQALRLGEEIEGKDVDRVARGII